MSVYIRIGNESVHIGIESVYIRIGNEIVHIGIGNESVHIGIGSVYIRIGNESVYIRIGRSDVILTSMKLALIYSEPSSPVGLRRARERLSDER